LKYFILKVVYSNKKMLKYLSLVLFALGLSTSAFGQNIHPLKLLSVDCQTLDDSEVCLQFNALHNQYQQYLTRHNKPHQDENHSEHWERFWNYLDFEKRIQDHNERYRAGQETWQAGHTRFTDMTPAEWHSTYKGYQRQEFVLQPSPHHSVYRYSKKSLASLPTAMDWRANGWVTDVKDQAQCGSCWAFSTTGTLEGQHANVTGNLVSLSEENIVDCVSTCGGCGGGWPYLAEDYAVQNGVDTEASYPYTAGGGMSGNCSYNKTNVDARFTQVVKLPQGDADALYHAVATVGPVSVAIDAEDDFMMYKAGIFSSKTCSTQYLDHAVLVVGYGVTNKGQKYYIVKNSWNTSWGMDGYVYWDATDGNMCGIAEDVSFAWAEANQKALNHDEL
jgi:cathepsin L